MINIEKPAHLGAIHSELSTSGLTRFLNRARVAIGLDGGVEVLLADDATLRRLNKSFRGKNKSTDVLSFPTPAEIADHHAGDLAISLETAARQATTYGHSLRDEVRILLLHGLLHLDGEDHETDDGQMATREAELRRELRLPNTLIERVVNPTPNGRLKSGRSAKPLIKAERPTRKPMKPSLAPQPAKSKRGRSV
jgi:probable rRNA maturation factor